MTLGELKKILAEQMEKVDYAIAEWGEKEQVQKVYEESDGTIDFDDLVNTSEEE